jgi:hypothetical protein
MEPKRVSYRVRLGVFIESEYEGGQRTNDQLTMEERFSVEAGDFTQLMGILGQVKGLADKIRAEQKP